MLGAFRSRIALSSDGLARNSRNFREWGCDAVRGFAAEGFGLDQGPARLSDARRDLTTRAERGDLD